MRSIVISALGSGSRSEDFEEKLNKALIGLDNKNCITHSIKYSVANTGTGGGNMIYSAVILYDEVPTRNVITEKIGE
jgi:hypothetical protein